MQFIDLKTQQARIRNKIEANIRQVLDHGQYILGPEITELEEKLSKFTGVKHAISCSSGTDALLMALMAHDVGPGDAIITTPFTFFASAEVITMLGAAPIFVDIDPKTFNIDPDKIEKTIAALKGQDDDIPLPGNYKKLRLKGIIAVDLFGQPADYEKINKTARKHGLFVIEDAAQSFGAEYKGKRTCSLSEIGCTSFFPAKPLGAYGDAGAVFTDDDNLAAKIKTIRVHGEGTDKYDNVRIGLNARMDTIQAAILLAKLEIFPDEIKMRQVIAQKYTELLGGSSYITCPEPADECTSAWAQYSILSERRHEIQKRLKENQVPTAVYYRKPLHRQNAFSYLGYENNSFPISEKVSELVFSLPMHPYLTDDIVEQICGVIKG